MLGVYAGAVALVAHRGLVGVAITVVVVYMGILAGVYRFLLQRYIGISALRLIPELGPAVAGCLALAAVGEPLRHLLEPQMAPFFVLAITGGAGILAYCLALRLVSKATWDDLRTLSARVFAPLPRGLTRRAADERPAPAPQPQRTAAAHPRG